MLSWLCGKRVFWLVVVGDVLSMASSVGRYPHMEATYLYDTIVSA